MRIGLALRYPLIKEIERSHYLKHVVITLTIAIRVSLMVRIMSSQLDHASATLVGYLLSAAGFSLVLMLDRRAAGTGGKSDFSWFLSSHRGDGRVRSGESIVFNATDGTLIQWSREGKGCSGGFVAA